MALLWPDARAMLTLAQHWLNIDLNLRNGRCKNTLLHYASKGNNLKILKYLLENHADIDVNLLNKFYDSAATIAAERGY